MSETPQRHTHSGPGDGGDLPANAMNSEGTRIYQSTQQTNLADSQFTTVNMDAVTFDDREEADLSIEGITVSEPGLYFIWGRTQLSDGDDGEKIDCNINVNGSQITSDENSVSDPGDNNDTLSAAPADMRYLSEGDTITMEVQPRQTAGDSDVITGEGATYLGAVQIG